MTYKKEDIINYRIEKAKGTMEEVRILVEAQKWNLAVSRLYYACFYLVIALLLKYDFRTKSHDGARNLLHQNFIKTGKLSSEMGRLYSELFRKRQETDYKDFAIFTQEDVEPLIPQAQDFIAIIKKLIENEPSI